MPQGYFFALIHFEMSEPVKYFQIFYICVGFGCAIAGTGSCSNCSVLICILQLCKTALFTCGCWCSCVCWRDVLHGAFLQLWEFLAAAVLGCGTSSKARLRFPGGAYTGAVKKGGLVEYIGNNVNTFYYDVMSRTMKMWLLYNYHSVGIQFFYFVTCGYETQKMQCNQKVNM